MTLPIIFNKYSTSFLMVCRLTDFALVVLKLLIFKVCAIIGILKIEFFNFSSTERVNIWRKNWLKKTLSHLAGLVHLCVFIWKVSISPRWSSDKIKWDPTSHINTYFYKSFLKKVRSCLGEPAHLTGPAYLHMKSF